jgi:hypothetical protein
MNTLQELKSRHAELKKQIVDESKEFFARESRKFFDKYADLTEFSWHQYTPYWNDGSECTFSVNSDPTINGHEKYDNDAFQPEAAYNEISNLLREIGAPTLKEMFGDHAEIIVRRDGVTVEEYSHD